MELAGISTYPCNIIIRSLLFVMSRGLHDGDPMLLNTGAMWTLWTQDIANIVNMVFSCQSSRFINNPSFEKQFGASINHDESPFCVKPFTGWRPLVDMPCFQTPRLKDFAELELAIANYVAHICMTYVGCYT